MPYQSNARQGESMKSMHQQAAEEAIKKLLETMDGQGLETLKGLKDMKPVAEMSVTKVSPLKKEDKPFKFGRSWDGPDADDDAEEESHESPEEEKFEEEHGEEDEPSDEDKMKIAAMYKKYCKGM